MSAPPLSVVVGSNNACTTIADILGTLVPQCDRAGADLVVVDNSTDGTDRIIAERFPSVTLVLAERPYIPELWGVGIEATTGDIVALTTAHCIPASDWVARILDAHAASEAAGIGGAIENDPEGTVTDWAVYFCRYHRFMPPLEAGLTDDIAGDNASYKRWALDQYRSAWRDGFWEPDVHAEIMREGGTLEVDPRIVVRHKRSFDLGSFLNNRYRHGQQYGGSQGRTLTTTGRVLHAVRAPLVPLVLTGRVARAVLNRGANTGAFARALPLLGLFYTSWAAGEATGYLRVEEDEED